VLLTSGDVLSEFRDVLSFNHSDIVSEAEPIVMERLNEDASEIYRAPEVKEEIGFWSEGLGDMEIQDPDGKTVAKDSSNVQDSKFSSESKPDGFKIASIPNPVKGDYTVTITNLSKNGEFHVGSEYVDNTGNGNDFSSVVSGTIEKNKEATLIVAVDPENTEKPAGDIVIKDETGPTVIIDSPKDGMEYSSDQTLPITFSVSDNISKSENIQTKIYLDYELLDGSPIDLSKLSLGKNHDFWINAVDEAGNYGEGEFFFKVKKAEPPIVEQDPVIPPVDNSSTSETVTTNSQTASSTEGSSNHHKKSNHKKKSHKKKKKKVKTFLFGLTKRVWTPTPKVLGASTKYSAKNSVTLWGKITQVTKTLRDFLSKSFKYFK